MPDAGPPTICRENRKHHRVIFTRTVNIVFGEEQYNRMRAKNLSLGGLFVEGSLDVKIGDACHLVLSETGRRSTLLLHIDGKVRRVEQDGIAVEFTKMEDDSYMFLQTMVLYSSDDPLGIVAEFLEDFPQGNSRVA